jgi:fibronectin-binding autotransporter adhesin
MVLFMKSQSNLFLIACAVLLNCPLTLFGQTSATWNVNNNGSWSAGTNWTGGVAPNGIGHTATFGVALTANRIATLDVNVTLGTLTFSGNSNFSYTLAGSNPLTFNTSSANAVINVNGGFANQSQVYEISTPIVLGKNLDINVSPSIPGNPATGDASLVLSGNISGTGFGINKLRPGLLILQGTNTFSGASSLALGELRLDRSTNNTSKISGSSTLALSNNLILSLVGNTAGSDQFVSTNWGNGHFLFRSIDPDAVDANVTTLNLTIGSISSNTGTYYFQSEAQSGAASLTQGRFHVNNINLNVNGLFTGRALVGTGANASFNDFASLDASGFIQAGPTGGYTSQSNASLWTTNQNISADSAFTGSVNTVSINSLRVNAGTSGNTLTINPGNTLNLVTGGLLLTSNVGANTTTITGGSISTGSAPMIIYHNNGSFGQENARLTIGSQITSATLIKEGAGTLELTNTGNSMTSTIIRSGTLRLFSDVPATGVSPIGSGTFLLGDAGTNTADAPHLILNGNITFSRAIDATQAPQYSGSDLAGRYRISVEGGNTATVAGDINYFQLATTSQRPRGLELTATSDADTLVVSGRIGGFGALQEPVTINGRGSGSGLVRLTNTLNAFSNSIVSNGFLEVGVPGANVAGGNSILQVGDAHTPSNSTRVGVFLGTSVVVSKNVFVVPNAANLTPDILTFGSIAPGGSAFTGQFGFSPALEDYHLQLLANTPTTYVIINNRINNPTTFTGPGGPFNSVVSLEKVGPGIVALHGANTNQGNTVVQQGKLYVNNTSGSGTGTGNVTVNAGGFGGSGSISGSVTLGNAVLIAGSEATGTLLPATLGVGGTVQLASSSTVQFLLGGTSPGDGAAFYGQVNVTGTALLDGALVIDAGAFNPTGGVYFLLNRGVGAGDGTTFQGMAEGATVYLQGGLYQGTITYEANWTGTQAGSALTGGNDVALFNVTAVPEPWTIGLLAMAVAGLVAAIRYGRSMRKQQMDAEVSEPPWGTID